MGLVVRLFCFQGFSWFVFNSNFWTTIFIKSTEKLETLSFNIFSYMTTRHTSSFEQYQVIQLKDKLNRTFGEIVFKVCFTGSSIHSQFSNCVFFFNGILNYYTTAFPEIILKSGYIEFASAKSNRARLTSILNYTTGCKQANRLGRLPLNHFCWR